MSADENPEEAMLPGDEAGVAAAETAILDVELEPEVFACDKCRDEGMAWAAKGGRYPCPECVRGENYWQSCAGMAGIPSLFAGAHLMSMEPRGPVQTKAHTVLVRWVRRFQEKNRPTQGLLIHGNAGSGKSLLAASAANALIRLRIDVGWFGMSDLYLAALASWNNKDSGGVEGVLRQAKESDVIVLDDLGVEKAGDFSSDLLLYPLLNNRAETKRLIIITTNLARPELEARVGERNASRLRELCFDVEVIGADQRRAGGASCA